MSQEEYLTLRLDDQISWHDTKSKKTKRWYYTLRTIELAAAAAIPFLAGFSATLFYLPPLIGLLGVVITICAGIISLAQFQMRWIQYRTLTAALQKEKYQFVTAVGPYNIDDKFPLLVKRIEDLLSNENTRWAHGLIKQTRTSGSQSIVAPSGFPHGLVEIK
jgi:hypothetical protein